jgi:hypothetical protein
MKEGIDRNVKVIRKPHNVLYKCHLLSFYGSLHFPKNREKGRKIIEKGWPFLGWDGKKRTECG